MFTEKDLDDLKSMVKDKWCSFPARPEENFKLIHEDYRLAMAYWEAALNLLARKGVTGLDTFGIQFTNEVDKNGTIEG